MDLVGGRGGWPAGDTSEADRIRAELADQARRVAHVEAVVNEMERLRAIEERRRAAMAAELERLREGGERRRAERRRPQQAARTGWIATADYTGPDRRQTDRRGVGAVAPGGGG